MARPKVASSERHRKLTVALGHNTRLVYAMAPLGSLSARLQKSGAWRTGRPYAWRYVENRPFSDVLVSSTNSARRHRATTEVA